MLRTVDLSHIRPCNRVPLSYFDAHGFSEEELTQVCRIADEKCLFARIIFKGQGDIDCTVSKLAFEKRAGHFPTVVDYFSLVAKHKSLEDAEGAIIVWLEDGFWPWHHEYGRNVPVLSFGRHKDDTRSFLIPDPAYMGEMGYEVEIEKYRSKDRDIPFLEKKPTVFFRGAASGCGIEGKGWRLSPRGKLMTYASELDDKCQLDAAFTRVRHLSKEQKELFEELGLVAKEVDFGEFLKYKYAINVDGYCCAWVSLFQKLATSSLVLNIESEFQQWYYEDLIPWHHYVPLAHDLSNFPEVYNWISRHDDKVIQIIKNANKFIDTMTFGKTLEEVALLVSNILKCRG